MNRCVTLGIFTLLLCLPLSIVGREIALPTRADDALEKKVVEIVKQTGDLYKNAKRLSAEATIVSTGAGEGGDKELKVSAIYEVQKPNLLSVRTKQGGDAKKGPDVIADGKNVIIYRKALGQYTEEESAPSVGEIGLGLLRIGPASVGMLFANILADEPADLLMQGVTSCSYVGKEKVDGTPAHRMKFSQPEFDWELWVAAEGKPFVLRMASVGVGGNGKAAITETYKNWKVDAEPAKDTFKFAVPADVKKVESFGDGGQH